MKVYLKAGQRDHTMFVTPGAESDSVEFKDAAGTNQQYTVKFVIGCAEVPSNLGRYMLDHGLAQRTPSMIVRATPHLVVPEERVRTHRMLG
jgi:hypothetical protein